MWRIWDVPGDPGAAGKLRDVPPGQDVDMEGQGEILRIEDRPIHGIRDLTIDATTKQITDEVFQTLPEPYRVARYGYSPNKVALTFDDGPDPEWTPKILDVLKRENAQATFFLIGIQTDKFPGLAQRIYREGHTIGNHTFTHPDVSNISSTQMRVELNLTERLFASLVGMRTILLRPPYAIDEEPDTADQVKPLEFAQDLGYITVGNRIDPNDWSDKPRRHTPEEISAYVLAHLPPCGANDLRCGNIILLHDGGGDRAETVAALPMIIEGIRARGLEIAPVYDLMGKTRAEVMAPLTPGERWIARLDRLSFWLFGAANMGITWIFFLGDLLMTGRLLFIGALAIYDRLHEKIFGRPAEVASYRPKVAVLIPAYNEEKVIVRTVRAALNSDYHNLRVIVIDDGSHDRTLEVARAAFTREEAAGKVLILTKPNAGKAEALNYGIEHIAGCRNVCRHRCRHHHRARRHLAPGAAFHQSQGWSRRRQRQSRQPRQSMDPLAGPRIHHQPEFRTPRLGCAGRGQRGAGRDRSVASLRRAREPAATRSTPSPKMPISPWPCCAAAIAWNTKTWRWPTPKRRPMRMA